MGSSYIRHLKKSLKEQGVQVPQNVSLIGYSKLKMSQLRAKLDKELSRHGSGNVVLHLGGNELVTRVKRNGLRN